MAGEFERIAVAARGIAPEIAAPKDIIHIEGHADGIGVTVQAAGRGCTGDEEPWFFGIDAIEDTVAAGFGARADGIAPEADVPSFGTEVFDIAASGFGIGAGIARISLTCGAFVVVNAGNSPCTGACSDIIEPHQIEKSFARTIGTADNFGDGFTCTLQTLFAQFAGCAFVILAGCIVL